MAGSFFFYDLETSGVDPRRARIMQFAGIRTDLALKPIGEPYNILIKLADDVLPDPDAVLLTGITPQKTLQDGISEAEFCKLFAKEIVQPDTCFIGYNNVRFDDEFMRFLLFRNFYDPYEWQWKNGSSRWDLLDVVRMTRALRPEGINWPYDKEGVCTNRLELLSAANKLNHESAHDALSDVYATKGVAQLIRNNHPKLFEYLYTMRLKKNVSDLVLGGQPFVYSSGRYTHDSLKTTVAVSLGVHPTSQGALVYDLRNDPSPFLEMGVDELVECWRYDPEREEGAIRLPVKSLQFNRSPAVAPLGVMDQTAQERLRIKLPEIKSHMSLLKGAPDFYKKVSEAAEVMNIDRDKKAALNIKNRAFPRGADEALYDSFIIDADRRVSAQVRKSSPQDISSWEEKFKDERLRRILPLYKARNFPESLTGEEREQWERHREQALMEGGTGSPLARFGVRLGELSKTVTNKNQQYLLEELRLYAESILPGN